MNAQTQQLAYALADAFNRSEAVKVVCACTLRPETAKMVEHVARQLADGLIQEVPSELRDIFTMVVVTRPSGSKYTLVNFI